MKKAFTTIDVASTIFFKISKYSVKGVKKCHLSKFFLGGAEYIFMKFQAEIYFFREN